MINVCEACGSKFKITYYQRRAADEPPDKVEYCTNCPLNTKQLLLSNTTKNSINKSQESYAIEIRNVNTLEDKIVYSETRAFIEVSGNAAYKCYTKLVENNSSKVSIIARILPIQTLQKKEIAPLHVNSIFSKTALLKKDSSKIAPLISLNTVDVYKSESKLDVDSNSVVIGTEYVLDGIYNVEKCCLRMMKGNKNPYILLLLDKQKPHNAIKRMLRVLEQLLLKYGTENNIWSFIDSSTINTLYVQSAKAFDRESAPKEGYIFTWKPDGERFWYIKYGYVWLFCRRLLSGKIIAWNIGKSSLSINKAGPILDVEVMIGHPPIFIDVLATESGVPTRQLRSLDDVLTEFRSMKSIDVPIFVRDYFNTEAELLKTKDSLTYPIDGAIAIEIGSVTIMKLKSIKSIELKLLENGDLISSDEKVVLNSELQNTYSPNSIIEIRFSRVESHIQPKIHEILLRTDKTKANEYSVCQEIMKLSSTMPDNLARRKALLWCNTIRQRIHSIAAKPSGRGRVVIDIGAGDGQAVSDYNTDSTTGYILLEPDKNKCQKLYKRLAGLDRNRCIFYDKPQFILKALTATSKGTLKYAVLCSSIEDILNQDNCIRSLKSMVKYCVASFSISHTFKSLQRLVLEGLQVIGCGYLYDNIDKNNILIYEHGVLMKKDSDTKAVVKWGTDKAYMEYPIVSKDFPDFNIKEARSIIPVITDSESSLLNSVSRNVYIIST